MGRLFILGVVVFLFSFHAACGQNSSCLLEFPGESKTYSVCNPLPRLGATLSWTYHPQNMTVDIAFRATPAASGGWVGWGINPTGQQMIGTQALIAFQHTNGSTIVDTYNVQSKSAALNPSNISIGVTNKSAMIESGKITIFASLVLSANQINVAHVWQVGSSVTNLSPGIHALADDNKKSLGTLNLLSEASNPTSAPSPQTSQTPTSPPQTSQTPTSPPQTPQTPTSATTPTSQERPASTATYAGVFSSYSIILSVFLMHIISVL